ncbi:MAG: MATE family efflux transporter [Taibaiella sp.]|nr:MATE family efflux transporter [Taibaiella sp.]
MKALVTNKEIIKLAAPISLALLIPQISFLTNTAFLGRLGVKELGVNGITGIFYLILAMIGYGLSNGLQIQMARRSGAHDREGLSKIFTNGLMLAVFLALCLMMTTLWLAPLIFGYSLHNTENILLSVNFLYIRVWGLPFLLLTQIFNSFFIVTGRSRYLVHGSVVATVVNIALDYVLIFGKCGFPQLGIMGAAIASVISEIAYCITLFSVYYFKKMQLQYPLRFYADFSLSLCQHTLKVATPLIIQFMFSIGGWQVFFIFIEHLGQRELAASQILRSIFGIVGIVTWAFAATCNTMVSNIIGQGRQGEVINLVGKIARLSILFTAVLCVTLFAFSSEFLTLYRDDAELIRFALPSLRVITLATLIMSLSTVVFNGVVGTGNTLVNLSIEIACVSSYLIYCYIVIYRMHSALYICWLAEFVYWSTLLLTSFVYLRSGRWKGKKI